MDISKFEVKPFARFETLLLLIKGSKKYEAIKPVIYMGEKAYEAFASWEDVQGALLEPNTNDLNIRAMLKGGTPIVVESNGGMELVMIPSASELYQEISSALPDEEPEVASEEEIAANEANNASFESDEDGDESVYTKDAYKGAVTGLTEEDYAAIQQEEMLADDESETDETDTEKE